jgi:hypothetical protein
MPDRGDCRQSRRCRPVLFLTLLLLGAAVAAGAGDDTLIPVPAARSVAENLRASLPTPVYDPAADLGLTEDVIQDLLVAIPMRDGAELAATILRPRSPPAARLPVILIRTPYRHGDEIGGGVARQMLPKLLRSGYAVVVVSDRGTQWSSGSYRYLHGQNRDGAQILDWIAAQPWSNGKVGTFGCSSSAESQLGLSTLNHPAHKAVIEMSGATGVGSVPGYRDQGIFFHGGIKDLVFGWWYRYYGHQAHPILPPGLSAEERVRVARAYSPEPTIPRPGAARGFADASQTSPEVTALLRTLPVMNILRAVDSPTTEWDRVLTMAPADPGWRDYDMIREGDSTRVPSLHVASWYDNLEAYPETKLYSYLAGNSPDQYLLMAGGPHCSQGTETADMNVGETSIGDARFDYVDQFTRWYDRWLKDDRDAIQGMPRVQYYLLNSGRWLSSDTWPVTGTRTQRLYFSSAGRANSRFGDGVLQSSPAAAQEPADEFVYDPLHPVPSLGGNCCSAAVAFEQSPVEVRQDVLTYTSTPFAKPLRLVGDVNVTVSVSTSVRDTDLIVRLVDVHPDGKAYNLAETGLRLRYLNGYERPKLLEPGQVYLATITGLVTATELREGHRLRVQITSSNFPNYERNLNTGGRNFDESVPVIARTRILHDATHPSYVEFPVLQE